MSTTGQVLLVIAGGVAASTGAALAGMLTWLTERRRLQEGREAAERASEEARRQERHARCLDLLTHIWFVADAGGLDAMDPDTRKQWVKDWSRHLAAVELVGSHDVRQRARKALNVIRDYGTFVTAPATGPGPPGRSRKATWEEVEREWTDLANAMRRDIGESSITPF